MKDLTPRVFPSVIVSIRFEVKDASWCAVIVPSEELAAPPRDHLTTHLQIDHFENG